jgi:predicted tellurium resistance membrane protein TerC
MDLSQTLGALIEIIWIDLVLAGENAIVLAMATRALPQDRKRIALNAGTILFILLRVLLVYALMAVADLPGFGFAAAALMLWAAFWVAMRGESDKMPEIAPRRTLGPVLAGALAYDAQGALLNMTGVVGAAQGDKPFVMLGLALSIPLLALGSAQFVMALRKPPILWASAGFLGWIAGRMAAADSLALASPMPAGLTHDFAPPLGALIALLLAFGYARGRKIKRVEDR